MFNNIRKYFLLTDTSYSNPNPGDILIGKGIEYLLRKAEERLNNFPIFNYVNIFNLNELEWERLYKEADYLIVCGTPQLGVKHIPKHFDTRFYNKLRIAKEKGIILANLWVGFADQNLKRNTDESILLILNNYKEFLNNYKIFDLIVTRDAIAHKTLKSVGIDNIRLLDSVFYSPNYYNIKSKEKLLNIMVIRNLNSWNEKLIKAFSKVKLDKSKYTIYLAHDISCFNAYYKKVPNLICINNPKSLLEVYSYAANVVSLRVHGSVPALYFGANVANISMDSRSEILNYIGLSSINLYTFVENPTIVKCSSINVQDKWKRDMDIFLDMFYNKCQKFKEL